jgi:hypothetical protein
MSSFKILMTPLGDHRITDLFKKDVSQLPQLAGKRIDFIEFTNYENMERRIGAYDFYIINVSMHSNDSVPDRFPWAKITNGVWGWIDAKQLLIVADDDYRNKTYIQWAIDRGLPTHHFTSTNYPEFLEKFITMLSKI